MEAKKNSNLMKKMKAMTRKEKIYELMTRPYTVVLVMVFAPMLNYLDRNFSYFFGLGVALLILWSSRFNWGLFGFEKQNYPKNSDSGIVDHHGVNYRGCWS